MKHATGTFNVKLDPQEDSDISDPTIFRMSIDKKFEGDIEGTSLGQMLATRTEIEGSAGYVAIEKVRGTVHGSSGTFALQHSSTMTRGEPQQSILVVPDSGTDELLGLTGTFRIIIKDGQHFYEFDYSLPE